MRHYDHETLHNIVGYIPQKAVLFSGDITSNMTMGTSNNSPLDDAKIWEALELAQGKDFVEIKKVNLKQKLPKLGLTSQVDRNNVWLLRVPWHVSLKS